MLQITELFLMGICRSIVLLQTVEKFKYKIPKVDDFYFRLICIFKNVKCRK
jgi:hypothetical protein